jgi:hypothetical protein
MQIPAIGNARHSHDTDPIEPIRCAPIGQPTRRRQAIKKEMLRYFVLVIALLAVLLLIAIALYYTDGNSVTIEHVGSLAGIDRLPDHGQPCFPWRA